ncbi:MAG: alpha/beta fold hydrolase [Oscillospiraceae bacterium]|nr:alpha/beta fold hydrolase [Oscillospiraceae bacterium]
MTNFLNAGCGPDISESGFSCSREGLTIRGTEYRPAGSNLPVAIVSHGFMANQDTVRHYARHLAEIGYAAYCFDFNGGSAEGCKSDGKTTDMSVLTEVLDLEAVIDHTLQLPDVDRSKGVVLMGCSQGGFVSALTAVRRKEQVSQLVLFYPALCIPDNARAGKMIYAEFDPHNVPERISCGSMELGRQYVTDVLDMDPFAEIIPYPGPVLIVHGTNDNIVHPNYSQRAFEAYSKRLAQGASVRLEMIEGGTHGFSEKPDALAIKKLDSFLQDQV